MKIKYDPGDSIINHKSEYTFRAAWATGVPAGMKGIQVVRENPKDVKYILVPLIEYEKFGWTKVVDPAMYQEWKR